MTLSALKAALSNIETLCFVLPNGRQVPGHFHITEVGGLERRFIDCGGTQRREYLTTFQIWIADDVEHRLSAGKFKAIIKRSEEILQLEDDEIEVSYQTDTIGLYGLSFDGSVFHLHPKYTDCLAKDACGIPEPKRHIRQAELPALQTSVCSNESGCC